LDFNSESEQHVEKGNDQEYKTSDYTTRLEAEKEQDDRGFQKWFMNRKKKNSDHVNKPEIDSPARFRSSKKKTKKKLDMVWVKLLFKIIVVAVVCYNFKFIWDYMKAPISNFTQILYVVGIRVGINFAAIWILFYKNSVIRFYLSLLAILGSFAYYFYENYMNHSFLGDNIIPSILVILSVLLVIIPNVNYYGKSIVLLLIPILGIYFSGNKFAIVWALMFNAGLILFFRVSKSKKSKSKEKEEPTRRNKKQSA
jgi:cell division protein FtsW (lipid II flippase)